jgi:hypothetical protein
MVTGSSSDHPNFKATALSTMEAEYIALSAGMCVVLHLGSIHKDVCT